MMGMGESEDPMAGKQDKIRLWESDDRVAILLSMEDKMGVLNDAMQIFKDHNINMTSIQSRPPK